MDAKIKAQFYSMNVLMWNIKVSLWNMQY